MGKARLSTQDFSPFRAPAGDSFSAMPRGHSFSETQLVFPFSTMRLICSLHEFSLSVLSRDPAFQYVSIKMIPYFQQFVKFFASSCERLANNFLFLTFHLWQILL